MWDHRVTLQPFPCKPTQTRLLKFYHFIQINLYYGLFKIIWLFRGEDHVSQRDDEEFALFNL